MRKLDINITGAGPHDVIPAIPDSRIIVQRLILTISHAKDKAQLVSFLSGSNLIVEFYVLDGGEIEYERREGDSSRVELGDAFNVTLEDDVSAAGVVFYEVGGQ